MDCSPPGSSVHGTLRAGILEWGAIPSSRGSSHPGIKPVCLTPAAGRVLTASATWETPPDSWGFPGGSEGKASACNVGDLGSIPGSGRFPWRRAWQPTPVFLPRESHGWRSLAGYSPRGHRVRHDWSDWAYTHIPPCFFFALKIVYKLLLANRVI